ncbi:MAG: fused MFS/spermidine synthase, partial [Alphaproteobacteria bacterium]|nr:fused MFS/spermidine synthase [Alphaproteobacteria bacterium]
SLIAIAILPIIKVFALRALRNEFFIRGAEVGIPETVASCFVLLLPYCIISGFLLTLASKLLASTRDSSSIGQVYFLDNIGDMLGGFLFSFILVLFFNHFEILYFPALMNLFFAGLIALLFNKRFLAVFSIAVTVLLVIIVSLFNLDDISLKTQYQNQEIVFKDNSPYGSLVVTKTFNQFNFIENGIILFSSHNVQEKEETVHYAMIQRPKAKNVLLISGGVSGTAQEILKYGVDRVDYVELDPLIIKTGQKFLPQSLDDERIKVINTDGRLFVKQTNERYDVVIADIPDPANFQLNRFYTKEFFFEVKKILNPDGVFAFSIGHYENYMSEKLAGVLTVAHKTAKSVFSNVLMIPSEKVFFLSSDEKLNINIAEAIEKAGIKTFLVNKYYLKGIITKGRLESLKRAVSSKADINTDFNPVLYFRHILHWLTKFETKSGYIEAGLLIFIVLCLFKLKPVTFAIFTTGFAASSMQIVLVLGFQILYGSVYDKLGVIVAMFMLGLGAGSAFMNKFLHKCGKKHLVWLEIAVAIYSLCVPFILMTAGISISLWLIPMLAFGSAVLVGLEFPLAGKLDFSETASTASRIYTADYIGSALGALLVSTILIPVIGILELCIMIAILNLISAGVIFKNGR